MIVRHASGHPGSLELSLKPPKWLRKAQPLKAAAKVVKAVAPVAAVALPVLGVAGKLTAIAKAAGLAKSAGLAKRGVSLVRAIAPIAANVVSRQAAATPAAPVSIPAAPIAPRNRLAEEMRRRVLAMRERAEAAAAQAAGPSPVATPTPVPAPPAAEPSPIVPPMYERTEALPSSTLPFDLSSRAPAAATEEAVATGRGAGPSPLLIAGAVVLGLVMLSGARGRSR